tara:strand:+ start:665 stop:1276 length:612 start_codon:yes stop_codon:yes gene_type:complete
VAGNIKTLPPEPNRSNNNMDAIIRNYIDTADKPRSFEQIKAIGRMIERHVSNLAAASFMAIAMSANAASPKVPEGNERNLCAAVLVLEAAGEGRLGMELVWQVVWQRASSDRWRSTPYGVCRQPLQFSCLNGLTDGQAIAKAQRSSMWRHALGITSAPPVYNSKVNAKGCDHYHATYIRTPDWAKGEKPRLTYKKHIFYKLED